MWSNDAYPQQLATFITEHWFDLEAGEVPQSEFELPGLPMLEALLSTAFQASLLREEEQALLFRLILAEPKFFNETDGPPQGLHRLVFEEEVPCSPLELKGLAHAASFYRSLLGVRLDPVKGPMIWGIVHSGPRWLQAQHGGRGVGPELPPTVVINVTGAGCIEVSKGSHTVGQLSQGKVFGPGTNVFQARWLQDMFAHTRAERTNLHNEARAKSGADWAALDPELTHIIDQHMMKRVLGAIRAFRHGGTLIMVPPERADELLKPNKFLNLRHKFDEGESRARFRTLIVSIMNTLAQSTTSNASQHPINWSDYQTSTDGRIAKLDEAIFEMSHLIAALSTVDGAVVLTQRFELLGFRAEIRCDFADVHMIARALDLEGKRFKNESTGGVGTRHRSAYQLCAELKDALVVVISQDGGVRFIRWNDGHVMYWDHHATFAFSQRF
jgi:DisA bacterial checkpoint controller nucleotide-binding